MRRGHICGRGEMQPGKGVNIIDGFSTNKTSKKGTSHYENILYLNFHAKSYRASEFMSHVDIDVKRFIISATLFAARN